MTKDTKGLRSQLKKMQARDRKTQEAMLHTRRCYSRLQGQMVELKGQLQEALELAEEYRRLHDKAEREIKMLIL